MAIQGEPADPGGRHTPPEPVPVGSRMLVEGTVGTHESRLAILNPTYRLLS